MPVYEFECQSCTKLFALSRPAHECGNPARCPNCSSLHSRRRWSVPCINVPDGDFDTSNEYAPQYRCQSVAGSRRSADAQERAYAKLIGRAKQSARDLARERRMSSREHSGILPHAVIPRELYEAEKRRSGNPNVWQEEGDSLLRKKGLCLGDT